MQECSWKQDHQKVINRLVGQVAFSKISKKRLCSTKDELVSCWILLHSTLIGKFEQQSGLQLMKHMSTLHFAVYHNSMRLQIVFLSKTTSTLWTGELLIDSTLVSHMSIQIKFIFVSFATVPATYTSIILFSVLTSEHLAFCEFLRNAQSDKQKNEPTISI